MLNERRMKMKKSFLPIAFLAVFMLTATNSQAQSWSDLLNKDNISKVVNAITGTTESIDMTGTWNYKGSAVEFESDNLLMKAGGAAAATMAENKLNEQLSKIGKLQFQFTGVTVQLGQTVEINGFHRQQKQQYRTENS